jgi:PncC family amidohydrolase
MSLQNKFLSKELNDKFWKEGLTLATAESCTAGNIAAMITAIPGSSHFYKGGIIAYSDEVKKNLLGVNPETLEKHGAVSEEVVIEMAKGAMKSMNSNCAVATSGIAGPTGGTPDKPVGTVWIAWATPTGTQAQCFHFGAAREREQITIRAVTEALVRLVKKLSTQSAAGC